MKLPISFEQFSKDPWKAVQFLLLIVVGYLWMDNKMNYQDQIDVCGSEVKELRLEVDKLKEDKRKADSTLARVSTKLEMILETRGIK